jgi:hypothetical protein
MRNNSRTLRVDKSIVNYLLNQRVNSLNVSLKEKNFIKYLLR